MSKRFDGSRAWGRVGFDFDGVLASEKRCLPFALAVSLNIRPLIRFYQARAACIMDPMEGIVISCRPQNELMLTLKWLDKHGLDLPLFLCADPAEKARKINEFKLDTYFENDLEVIELLQKRCPDCLIIAAGEIKHRRKR